MVCLVKLQFVFSQLQLEAKLIELKQLYDDKLAQKEELKRKAEYTEMMLDRAQKLVLGLASEHVVWMETVKVSSV